MLVVLIGLFLTGCGALSTALLSQGEDERLAGRSGSFSVDDGTQGDSADNPNGDSALEDDGSVGNPVPGDDETGTDAGVPGAADTPLVDDPANNPSEPPLIINTSGGQPVDPFLPDPPDTVDPIDSSVFDPFGAFLGDPALFGDLLPFLLDGLLIDLLDPTGSSTTGNADSFSNLELLCRDRGLPETYCRRRYAN